MANAAGGICDGTSFEKYNHQAFEAWGKGRRFGFTKINDKEIYWFAVVDKNLKTENNNLKKLFKDFHPDILYFIDSTKEDQIIFNLIQDLKPIYKWHVGNAGLMGDAAHATTPNMGQGACQAIEDAYVFGNLFNRYGTAQEVFSEFEKKRMKKAHNIVNTSWKIGKAAHYDNDFAIWLRNTILKHTPISVKQNQLATVFDIGYK